MFAIVIGFVLALIFFGLPLGIIGLFILSILDQKSRGVKNAPQYTSTLASHGVNKYELTTAARRHRHAISPRNRRQLPGAQAPRSADTATAETWGRTVTHSACGFRQRARGTVTMSRPAGFVVTILRLNPRRNHSFAGRLLKTAM